MDCIYCKLVKGELPVHKVGENAHALAFLDISPLSKGHTLVIPKKHIETILDMEAEEVGELFKFVRSVTNKLQLTLKPDGFNLGINMHQAGGAMVEHLHVHIIPRWQNDGGGSIHSIIKNPPTESLAEILKEINSK